MAQPHAGRAWATACSPGWLPGGCKYHRDSMGRQGRYGPCCPAGGGWGAVAPVGARPQGAGDGGPRQEGKAWKGWP